MVSIHCEFYAFECWVFFNAVNLFWSTYSFHVLFLRFTRIDAMFKMKYFLLLTEKLSIYSAHYPWIRTFFSVVRTGTISSPLQILCSFVFKFSDDCFPSLGKQMHTLFSIHLNTRVSSVDLQSSFLQSCVLLYLFVHLFCLPPRHLWNYGLLSFITFGSCQPFLQIFLLTHSILLLEFQIHILDC